MLRLWCGHAGMLVTGHPRGEVYFWRGGAVVRVLQTYDVAPEVGPKLRMAQHTESQGAQ